MSDPLSSAPEDGRTREEELLHPVEFSIEPILLAPPYRVGLLVAALTVVILPLIYVGLIVLAGYGVWYHASHNYTILLGGGSNMLRVVGYVTPVVAGVLGVLFMIKPLFAPLPSQPRPKTLTRADQPLLHDYVERLCRSLGAPVPRRIDVDMQVNASASFRRGVGSFLSEDLVLTLGLPLTAGMTLGQWTGVLAHEFGHFTQGSAMRFTYVIGSVNHWFARVVHERDQWDERLARTIGETGSFWVQVILQLSQGFIWLSRRVLWALMMVGLGVSSFLSRQMEFNADLHQARVSGSEIFRSTHLRLQVLSIAWSQATQYVSQMWNERRLVDDLASLVVADARQLIDTEGVPEQIETGVLEGQTGFFDTHPSTADRIKAVEATDVRPRVVAETPASELIVGFEELCQELTRTFYERGLGTAVEDRSLVATASAVRERDTRMAGARALGAYFLGAPFVSDGVFPTAELATSKDVRAAKGKVAAAREAMRAALPAIAETSRRLEALVHTRRQTGLVLRLNAAKVPWKPADFGVESDDDAELRAVRTATLEEREERFREQHAAVRAAMERTETLLGIALRPEISATLNVHGPVVERLPDLLAVLGRIGPHWRGLAHVTDRLYELQFMASISDGTQDAAPFQDQVVDLWESLHAQVVAIRSGVRGVGYPYPHADGPTDVADYLFPEVPEPGPDIWGVAAAGTDRLVDLYHRAWSDIAALALEVEEVIGLEPLAPPEGIQGDASAEESPPPS